MDQSPRSDSEDTDDDIPDFRGVYFDILFPWIEESEYSTDDVISDDPDVLVQKYTELIEMLRGSCAVRLASSV